MLKLLLITFLSFILLNANNLKELKTKIHNIKQNTATINIASLQIGQTGSIIHIFSDNKSIILKKAKVISSNNNSSIIKFMDTKILEQKSISNTKLKPQNGDIFILNHMYNVSLLIVPNFQAYKSVVSTYNNNFINSDLFASYLKINEKPIPNKSDFIEFTKNNNIATIYIVIASKLYILDALTFKIIQTSNLNINNKKFQSPFYTNILDIKTSTFDFTSKEKLDNYNEYYKKLIGANNDR